MPVVRLVDGGITDNLSVRGSIMSPVTHYGNVPDMAGAFTQQALGRVCGCWSSLPTPKIIRHTPGH